MNVRYEYYYMFGLDIPLSDYGLGIIKQPKIIDYISKDVSIESLYIPFIMNDIMLNAIDDKESAEKLVQTLGSLTFLLDNSMRSDRADIIFLLESSLKLLYKTDNVVLKDDLSFMIDDNININNSNFDTLSKVVLDILKLDKSKMKFDNVEKKELSDIEKEFERRRKKHEEMSKSNKKKEGFSILDLANIVIHSGIFKYEDVLNMTVYQLKNSYDIINQKDSFNISMLHRISPKFESGDKFEHWTEKIKLDKSTLSQND